MASANKHFTSMKKRPHPGIVARAGARPAEDEDHETGMYRSARDYPIHDFAYLEFAEVEENAHNPAYFDAAEALDMN